MKLEKYQDKIVELVEEGKLPMKEVSMVEVAHDDSCKLLLGGGACNCDPDIYFKGEKLS